MGVEKNRFRNIYREGFDYIINSDILGPECELDIKEISSSLFPLLGEDIIDLVWDVKKKAFVFRIKT